MKAAVCREFGQPLPDAAKGVGKEPRGDMVARIHVAAQGDLSLTRHQQREAEQTQVAAFLLGSASLGQLRLGIGGGDVGEEVGGVVKERVQVETQLPDHGAGQLALDGSENIQRDTVHLVPEELRRQRLHLQARKEPVEGGCVRPFGPASL